MLLPWLIWRCRPVRQMAPLAVVQILVGVALGPSLLGRAAPGLHGLLFGGPVLAALDGIASLGVLLYVFVAGMHLDVGLLRRQRSSLGAMALGSLGVPLLVGACAGGWILHIVPSAIGPLGNGGGFVAAVAICVAVTALPVLAAVLEEIGLLGTRIGQTALALAAINDAMLWVMLAVLLISTRSAGYAGGLFCLGVAVAWFAALILAIRPGLAPLSRASDQTKLVCGVALAVLSAAVSEALGTGYLVGAFVAGAVMPASCRVVLIARLEMVTLTVLLPFFFMSTGLKAMVEPGSARFLGLVAVVLVATVGGKLLGTAIPARRRGFSWQESLSLGAMMQTKGLMEVVVLAALHDAGLIGGQIFSAMVAMAVVCTVVTAPVVRLCQRIGVRRGPNAATGHQASFPLRQNLVVTES